MKCYKESPERALLVHLAERACVPYLDTLGRWLYEGVIVDPFREFLVQESPPIKNRHALSEEEYWERKYKLDEAMCPDFLFPYMEKIIKAGKYLNVATASGAAAKCPFAAQISYTTDTHAYARDIEKAYDFASEQLLRLLRDDLHIMTHMRSIKLFFLMERGDMYEQLMLTGRLELQQPRAEIQESVLDALLRNSIASSTAATDPNGRM
ncbi:hypothetical protein SARC_03020 [Sphaeroforma arctica JP610]|uniref:Spindle pole body component n=1 Tax=Sphaeroforma arctica JP610 TaxID=667725 RepID=A0A0L0G954_9EUKA|nr:hypothetical protein SARC_03020 [Sphaeroforma arctica JP610]KNC84778.1 hypothetical protein SARC_03020 [Sphaeroforma arctica JP610]|eukprot:XP_014158680.1 hypothetical protein SARC_03020 [Sphaeroforma arctica JP610]